MCFPVPWPDQPDHYHGKEGGSEFGEDEASQPVGITHDLICQTPYNPGGSLLPVIHGGGRRTQRLWITQKAVVHVLLVPMHTSLSAFILVPGLYR